MFPDPASQIRDEDQRVRVTELVAAIRWQFKIPATVEVVVTDIKPLAFSHQGTEAAITIDGEPFHVREQVVGERMNLLKYAGGSRVKQLAARALKGPVELANVLERLRSVG